MLRNSVRLFRRWCLLIGMVAIAVQGGPAVAQNGGSLNEQLFVAAGRGELGLVTDLLQKGADPNYIDRLQQRTVLQSAVIGDLDLVRTGAHLQVVKLLLLRGAKFEAQPGALGTALFDAVGVNGKTPQTGEQIAIVELLLKSGASVGPIPDFMSEQGPTPLHQAAFHAHLESAQLLIAHGADVNAIDPFGATPLQALIGSPTILCKQKAALIAFLKKKGASGDVACHDEPEK